ncbi:XRE family transcriptional regulator [Alkalihalophilus pseudofirmus OF4]|uniref:XRE family transcriptional regulator n=1 Tax=Alkalihalophilus pseudofirmus (strain ATCC BAA-2126 / JCM 17055 / OF4) TaxID=398511 RepID=D3FYT8_ALKPO|nr:helix-turn-helix domain-containing protein [Alkalihalophilus pseudofirmus]ADC48971.1 XRE family transcriptional regulator [Alkalihalophilus pseudofirmus OF4]
MFGIGKPRSKFGKKIDKYGITQLDLEKESNLSRGTISKMCNDKDYRPKMATELKVKKALINLGQDPSNFGL